MGGNPDYVIWNVIMHTGIIISGNIISLPACIVFQGGGFWITGDNYVCRVVNLCWYCLVCTLFDKRGDNVFIRYADTSLAFIGNASVTKASLLKAHIAKDKRDRKREKICLSQTVYHVFSSSIFVSTKTFPISKFLQF